MNFFTISKANVGMIQVDFDANNNVADVKIVASIDKNLNKFFACVSSNEAKVAFLIEKGFEISRIPSGLNYSAGVTKFIATTGFPIAK